MSSEFKAFIKRQLKRIPVMASIAMNMRKMHIVDDKIQVIDTRLGVLNELVSTTRNLVKSTQGLQDELTCTLANFEKSIPVVLRNCARQARLLEATVQPGLPATALDVVLRRIEYIRCELLQESGGMEQLQRAFHSHAPRIVNQQKLAECSAAGSIRLNICCGCDMLEDYLNVAPWPADNIDIVAEASNLPFTENQVDEIHVAHMDACFPASVQHAMLLPYWRNLLKPCGVLRCDVYDATPFLPALQALGFAAIDFAELPAAEGGQIRYEVTARQG